MKISLIIASRGRPDHLRRLLHALGYQRDITFEVIVVTDQSDLKHHVPRDCQAKLVPCEPANLAHARNLGLAASGADIVAFCDDDAVPHPNWLARLTRGFADPNVNSACGFTRGRNGVSYQWKAMLVDGYGNDHPIEVSVKGARSDQIKTVGTNMAFRRSALAKIGGFDEAYRFFLEDADINLRLYPLGGATYLDPKAEVQHAFAPSNLRHFNRVPKNLHEIGASKAYFCHRHGAPEKIAEELSAFFEAQSARLRRFHNQGLMSGDDVAPLLESLRRGFDDGAMRQSLTPFTGQSGDFLPYQSKPCPSQQHVLSCGLWDAPLAKRKAAKLAKQGHHVALVQFIYSPRRLSVRFTDDGYWLHKGGVFGQGPRSDPHFRLSTRKHRIAQEMMRIDKNRTIPAN